MLYQVALLIVLSYQLDPTVAAMPSRFVPPLHIERTEASWVYTDQKIAKYTITKPNPHILHRLSKHSYGDVKQLYAPNGSLEQVVMSHVITEQLFETLIKDCRGQVLPSERHPELEHYFNADLILKNTFLEAKNQELLPDMRTIDSYRLPGLSSCQCGKNDSLVWSLWLFIRPKDSSWEWLHVNKVHFRFYGHLCSNNFFQGKLLFHNQTFYRPEPAKALNNSIELIQATELSKNFVQVKCIEAIVGLDWEFMKIFCTLECDNFQRTFQDKFEQGTVISPFSDNFTVQCLLRDELFVIPEIGSVMIRVEDGCFIEVEKQLPRIYPSDTPNNKTHVEVIIPVNWARNTSSQNHALDSFGVKDII